MKSFLIDDLIAFTIRVVMADCRKVYRREKIILSSIVFFGYVIFALRLISTNVNQSMYRLIVRF